MDLSSPSSRNTSSSSHRAAPRPLLYKKLAVGPAQLMGQRTRRPSARAEEAARDAAFQTVEAILSAGERGASQMAPPAKRARQHSRQMQSGDPGAGSSNGFSCSTAAANDPVQPSHLTSATETPCLTHDSADAVAAVATTTAAPSGAAPSDADVERRFDIGGLPLDVLEAVVGHLPFEELLRISLVSGTLAAAAEPAFKTLCGTRGWRFPRRPRGLDASRSLYPWRMLYR